MSFALSLLNFIYFAFLKFGVCIEFKLILLLQMADTIIFFSFFLNFSIGSQLSSTHGQSILFYLLLSLTTSVLDINKISNNDVNYSIICDTIIDTEC